MRHIHKINSEPYTVIVADEPLEDHITITNYPQFYEISNTDLPEGYQMLNYIYQNSVEVQLWRIRTILKLMDLENSITNILNNLDEPVKTTALYVWNYGTTIERNSQMVFFLQSVLGITNEQVDDIFIEANNISI